LHYTGGKPYVIQRLCSAAVRRALAENRFHITVQDIQQAHQGLTAEDERRAAEEQGAVSYSITPAA